MCTTTVYLAKDRRVVTMNRDESRSRSPVIEPQTIHSDNEETDVLMPIDGSSRGTWRGSGDLTRSLQRERWAFFTSSSVEPEAVSKSRSESFEDWLSSGFRSPEEVLDFHFYQEAQNASWSPLMSRKSSCTRSVTQVTLDETLGIATMRYWGRPASNEPNTAPSFETQLELIKPKRALLAARK